jgi:hypothetical protein
MDRRTRKNLLQARQHGDCPSAGDVREAIAHDLYTKSRMVAEDDGHPEKSARCHSQS